MATITELAQMSSNVYDGTSGPTQNTGPLSPLLKGLTNWVVIANSNLQNPAFWSHGYEIEQIGASRPLHESALNFDVVGTPASAHTSHRGAWGQSQSIEEQSGSGLAVH